MKEPVMIREARRIRKEEIRPGTPLWDSIVSDLKGDMSMKAIARKHGIVVDTVTKINFVTSIRATDWQPGDDRLSAANRAKKTYDKARRVDLLDRLFAEAENMIDICEDPQDLDKLIGAIAKLIDKRRLEDGEATSRSESAQTVAKDTLEAKLDDLAKRRAANEAKNKTIAEKKAAD